MAEDKQETNSKLAYLAKDSWSPRFDATFYTVQLEGHETRTSASLTAPFAGSRHNFPAEYYAVAVFRSQSKNIVWRRFSEFKALHHTLHHTTAVPFPPSTCPWYTPDSAFLNQRQAQLAEYLEQILENHSSNTDVLRFLELQ